MTSDSQTIEDRTEGVVMLPSQPLTPQSVYPHPAAPSVSASLGTPDNPNYHVDNRRVIAALIDIGIVFAVLSFTRQGGFSRTDYAYVGNGRYTEHVAHGLFFHPSSWTGFAVSVGLICAYFVLLEMRLGATIGKLLLGIRVTKLDGSNIGIGSSVIRNLMRIIDAFPYFFPYLLGIVAIATSSRRQRLGDKLASTVVVRASASTRPNA